MEAATVSLPAQRVIASLKEHTPFAEAIVKRQVERAGLNLASFREEDLARVGPMIVSAAKVFLDPVQLAQVKRLIA